jgi:hypothetical protein
MWLRIGGSGGLLWARGPVKDREFLDSHTYIISFSGRPLHRGVRRNAERIYQLYEVAREGKEYGKGTELSGKKEARDRTRKV